MTKKKIAPKKKSVAKKVEKCACVKDVNFFLILLFCFIFATVFLAAFF